MVQTQSKDEGNENKDEADVEKSTNNLSPTTSTLNTSPTPTTTSTTANTNTTTSIASTISPSPELYTGISSTDERNRTLSDKIIPSTNATESQSKPTANFMQRSDREVNITVTSMDSALSNSDNCCSDIEIETPSPTSLTNTTDNHNLDKSNIKPAFSKYDITPTHTPHKQNTSITKP